MFIKRRARQCNRGILIPLCVLMWKYILVWRHRYCYTIWEVFGGVSVFLVIFLINHTVSPKNKENPLRNSNNDVYSLTRVYYTPHNKYTRRLMGDVGRNLLKNHIDADFQTNQKNLWEFEHDIEILPRMKWPKRSFDRESVALVKFEQNELSNFSKDSNLTYSISVPGEYIKNELDEMFNGFFHSIAPKEQVIPRSLVPLQWAIDKSFIEERYKTKINQKIQLRAKPEYISKKLATLHNFLVLCTIMAPLPFFLINSSRLIIERRSGQKELMKQANVSVNVLRLSHFLQSVIVGVCYALPITFFFKGTSKPLVPYSNGIILFLTLVFHFVNSASLAFVTTTVTQDLNHADSLGILFYMLTLLLDFLWYSEGVSMFILFIFCCIMPHAPIYMFWDEVVYLESLGQGIQFWNMQQSHDKKTCISVLSAWGFFAIQITVIMTVAWYLDLVRPGKYGVSKKLTFIFRKKYWFPPKKRIVNFHMTSESHDVMAGKRDQKFFERGPTRAEIAIKILDVTKIFTKQEVTLEKMALDSVSFDCYQGEITMVLGANGAGKTTLLNIVTGMFSATSGKVYINGKDVQHRIAELHEDIALCPQTNIVFPYLTVKEHILFYQMLKRTRRNGHEYFKLDQLMKKLKLTDKANCYTHQLSNGMLRCLQVACSLAGGADVLVMDEPTSGMDVETRHRLWDLLMGLREKKTILMTTSFLEEATALGDRVVILDSGKMRCHGTPQFLKHAIGVSFNLSITIQDSTQMKNLKKLIGAVIPGVKYRIHDIRRITFSLPSKEHEKLPHMFDILEEKKSSLGITLMDIGMFMEEVFLEFIEEDTTDDQWDVESSISYRHVEMERSVGLKLIRRQFTLLVIRLFNYYWKKKIRFILLQILVPVIGFILVAFSTNQNLAYNRLFNDHHSQHHHTITAIVFSAGPYRRSDVLDIANKFPGFTAMSSNDGDRDTTNSSFEHMDKTTIGLNISAEYAKIFHNLDPHTISKSINLYSNMFLSLNMPDNHSIIRTTYSPELRSKTIKMPKDVFQCLEWAVWVGFVSIIPLAPFIILAIEEYRNGSRHNHMMAGCTPLLHWGSKLFAHLAAYWIIIPVPLLFITLLLEKDNTFNQIHFMGALLILLVAFGPAFLTHLYLLSFILHQNVAMCHIYIMAVIFGIILPIVIAVLEQFLCCKTHYFMWIMLEILKVISRVSPLYSFAIGLGRLSLQARSNAYCRMNRSHMCPDLQTSDSQYKIAKICCESQSNHPFPYLSSKQSGLHELLVLFLLIIINMIVVLLLENRILQYILERIIHVIYRPPVHDFHEPNVLKEKVYVEQALRYHDYNNDILLVDNIHKHYSNFFNTLNDLQVVNGISFAARKGECVALLGPLGSGKSSLLEMLAGTRVMTRGNAIVDGKFIRRSRAKYIHKISLTSDGGMDGFMTGHENLVFVAQLRGYCDEMATKLSLLSLRFMGLHPDQIKVANYSAGCRRRLSLCNTLVLAPSVALLDEPMLNTDANTKPLIAKAITRLMLEPAAVVVTESSVDWRQMQTVFTRIGVIASGQLAIIGPADEIIASLAKGYTVRIKLKVFTAYREDRSRKISSYNIASSSSESEEEEEDPGMHTEKSVMYAKGVTGFKREFMKVFETCTVAGEHLCMLYFDITDDNLKYSDMFQKLEVLKKKFDDVVEDYSVSSTTVEDVFLRITRDVHEEMRQKHPHK